MWIILQSLLIPKIHCKCPNDLSHLASQQCNLYSRLIDSSMLVIRWHRHGVLRLRASRHPSHFLLFEISLMNLTRVLISIEQRLERQLIKFSLGRHPEVEIVGQSLNVIEIMALIAQYKPHVWIHSFGDGPEFRTIRSHVCSVAPELIIASVDPNDPCGFLQVPFRSVDELISQAIRFSECPEPTFASNQQY